MEKAVGAQPGNLNSLKNGSRLRTNRGGIVLAELGKRYATINVHLWQLRKALESQVAKSHGSLSLVNVAKINEVLRWEMTARVTQKLIADTTTMSPSETISALNTIGNATSRRNSLLNKLLGDGTGPAADASVAALYAMPQDNAAQDESTHDLAADRVTGNGVETTKPDDSIIL